MMASHFWNIPGIWSRQSLEFLERSLNPICVYDHGGQVIYASPRFSDLLQIDINQEDFFDHFVSVTVPQTLLNQLWQRTLQGEAVYFLAQLPRSQQNVAFVLEFDPETKVVLAAAQPRGTQALSELETKHQTLLVEYERAIDALVKTEEKWKALVLNSTHLFLQTTGAGQILYASPAVEQVLGYAEVELLGTSLLELIHPTQGHEITQALQDWSSQSPEPCPGLEGWYHTKSGRYVCLYLQGQRFPSALGLDGVAISGYNITDRKCLEAKLQASEQRCRALVLNLPSACRRPAPYAIEALADSTLRSWDVPHPPS